jgi:hypothetical protein
VAPSNEHGNELSGCVNDEKVLEQVRDYQLLK